jgi:phage shock protein A
MRSGGRSEDILASEAGLTAAEAKLHALRNGADDGARQAQQCAVDSDAAAVVTAEVAYAALRGQNSANLQAAQAQVDSLEAQIAIAQSLIKSFVQLKDRNLRTCTPANCRKLYAASVPTFRA